MQLHQRQALLGPKGARGAGVATSRAMPRATPTRASERPVAPATSSPDKPACSTCDQFVESLFPKCHPPHQPHSRDACDMRSDTRLAPTVQPQIERHWEQLALVKILKTLVS